MKKFMLIAIPVAAATMLGFAAGGSTKNNAGCPCGDSCSCPCCSGSCQCANCQCCSDGKCCCTDGCECGCCSGGACCAGK